MKPLNFFLLLLSLFWIMSCGGSDPNDEVRFYRRNYQLSWDFSVDETAQTLSYEIKVNNKAGNLKLHDLTVDASLFDDADTVLWTKRHVLSVAEIPEYGTHTFPFVESIPEASRVAGMAVVLAPDGVDDPFQSYQEFMRIVPQ